MWKFLFTYPLCGIEPSCSDFFRCLARALGVSTFHYPPPLSFEILSICPSLFDIMYKFKSSPNFDRNYEETLLI